MAEAIEQEPATDVALEVEPETVVEPVVEPGDDREPGGDDGASVYARKKAREAKQLRTELEQERQERIRAEERAKVLAEQAAKAPADKQRIYTIEELDAAVEAKTITSTDRARYIDQVIIPNRIDERLNLRDAENQKKAPLERAKAEVAEYVRLIPALADKNSAEFKKVAAEYQDLVADGYPANDITERTAAKMALGSLEALRKKHEMANLSRQAPRIPTDGSGGGSPPSTKIDINKAPAEFQQIWNATGTSPEAREAEYKIYLARQKK